MDLGECPKVHDLALRADYENAAKHKDYYYDIDVRVKNERNNILTLFYLNAHKIYFSFSSSSR